MGTAEDTRALTLHQPWAALVASGAKPVEKRSWKPPARFSGPLLIHAGLAYDRMARSWPCVWDAMEAYTGPVHTGAVVAVAFGVSAHRADGCCAPWGDKNGFHWTYRKVAAFEPVYAPGRQGLWVPSAELLSACRAAYRAAQRIPV